MFEITSSTTNLFRFYRTPTALTSARFRPQITSINDVPYLLVPTDHTFHIYNLQDLSLHFLGPRFSRMSCILLDGAGVFVCEAGTLHRVNRGEIVASHSFGAEQSVAQMLQFGEYIVLQTGDCGLIVCSYVPHGEESEGAAFVTELLRRDCGEKIDLIYHPHTYMNKILIIYESGRMELFNINTEKVIFSFDLEGRVTAVCQTAVLDVLGFGLEDGTVRVFNLKKNRILFDISNYKSTKKGMEQERQLESDGAGAKPVSDAVVSMNIEPESADKEKAAQSADSQIKHIDFKDRYALAIIGSRLIVYDLELKKEVFSMRGARSGLFINAELFLVTTADTVEIRTIGDFALLKKRSMITGQIHCIEAYGGKNILLVGNDKLFKMSIYKDEQSCFLKNSNPIERFAAGRDILLYGNGQITHIKEGASKKFIDKRCDWLRTHKDFCLLGSGRKCYVMNLQSKRIVLEHESQQPILCGDFNDEKFVIATATAIKSYNFRKEEIFSMDLEDTDSTARIENKVDPCEIRIVGNLYFLKRAERLVIICNTTSREFKAQRYALDPTNRFLAVIFDGEFCLYDVLSGNAIERMRGNVGFKDVAILDDLKFVALLDTEDNLHLLSNHSHFSKIHNSYMAARHTQRAIDIPVVKKESTFYKELALHKDFGGSPDLLVKSLDREEVLALLIIVENNIDRDFHGTQSVLNKILAYKSHVLQPGDVARIAEKVQSKWREYEDRLVKCLGYLELAKENML